MLVQLLITLSSCGSDVLLRADVLFQIYLSYTPFWRLLSDVLLTDLSACSLLDA